MFKEFKQFIMRGNVLDLAIAVIIGGVFGKVVSSLVNDVIMPPIGLVLGNVDFCGLYLNLSSTTYPTLVRRRRRVSHEHPEGARCSSSAWTILKIPHYDIKGRKA